MCGGTKWRTRPRSDAFGDRRFYSLFPNATNTSFFYDGVFTDHSSAILARRALLGDLHVYPLSGGPSPNQPQASLTSLRHRSSLHCPLQPPPPPPTPPARRQCWRWSLFRCKQCVRHTGDGAKFDLTRNPLGVVAGAIETRGRKKKKRKEKKKRRIRKQRSRFPTGNVLSWRTAAKKLVLVIYFLDF